MSKQRRIHNFYLSETDSDESTGYLVKQLNGKGEVVLKTFIPIEQLEWFRDKDYKIVSREEFEKVGERLTIKSQVKK